MSEQQEPTAWVLAEDGDPRDIWDDLFWTREDAEDAARGLPENLVPLPLFLAPAA